MVLHCDFEQLTMEWTLWSHKEYRPRCTLESHRGGVCFLINSASFPKTCNSLSVSPGRTWPLLISTENELWGPNAQSEILLLQEFYQKYSCTWTARYNIRCGPLLSFTSHVSCRNRQKSKRYQGTYTRLQPMRKVTKIFWLYIWI